MLKSKIHRATVTQADLHYVGSLTIDGALMREADLLPGEQVDIVDINNGERLTTYVIEGDTGSGIIGINGAAARKITPGDLVIIISYAVIPNSDAADYTPRVVMVDANNEVISRGADLADTADRHGLKRGDLLHEEIRVGTDSHLG